MTLDEAVMWLDDRCGKSVAVWISDEHSVRHASAEGELRRARDASGVELQEEGCYDVGHVRIFIEGTGGFRRAIRRMFGRAGGGGAVGLIEYGDDAVNVFMTTTYPPHIKLEPNEDAHLLVQFEEVGVLHIVEQKDPPV